jgi:hypothetical protein
MIIKIPVSIGELLDKISILQIKSNNIVDANKLKNVFHELTYLFDIFAKLKIEDHTLLYDELFSINKKLWDLEDSIRVLIANKQFDLEFIDISISIHNTNDKRCQIKTQINQKYNSEIFEVKSY